MYTELDNYAQAVQGRTEARRALEDESLRIGELEAKAKERPTLKVGETYIVEPKAPWYPPQQEGFGPWIEGEPKDGPDDVVFTIQVLTPPERRQKRFEFTSDLVTSHNWSKFISKCVAYCVKL
jgi:hypothetical protein